MSNPFNPAKYRDDNDREKAVTINFPGITIMSEVLQKGFQAGSLLGVGVVAPIVALWNKSFEPDLITTAVAYSAVATTGISSAAGSIKFISLDKDQAQDHAHRVYYDDGQQRLNAFSAAGMLLGAAATAYWFQEKNIPIRPINLIGGSAAGSALGFFTDYLTRPEEYKAAGRRAWDEARDRTRDTSREASDRTRETIDRARDTKNAAKDAAKDTWNRGPA